MRTAEKTVLKFDFSNVVKEEDPKGLFHRYFVLPYFCIFFVMSKKSSIVAWVVRLKLELLSVTTWQTRTFSGTFSGPKSFRAFWETRPWIGNCVTSREQPGGNPWRHIKTNFFLAEQKQKM